MSFNAARRLKRANRRGTLKRAMRGVPGWRAARRRNSAGQTLNAIVHKTDPRRAS